MSLIDYLSSIGEMGRGVKRFWISVAYQTVKVNLSLSFCMAE